MAEGKNRRTELCKHWIPERQVQALPELVLPEGRLVFTVMRHLCDEDILQFEYRVVLRGLGARSWGVASSPISVESGGRLSIGG